MQSETSSLAIPELELELQPGTLGGRFTTIEGILTQVIEQLSRFNPFAVGDSGDANSKMKTLINNLEKVSC